jgi:hypothetical protein
MAMLERQVGAVAVAGITAEPLGEEALCASRSLARSRLNSDHSAASVSILL